MLRESNALLSAVAVCGTKSLLIHTTRSPRCTVSTSGLKRMFSMVMTCVFGAAPASDITDATPPVTSKPTRTILHDCAVNCRRFRLVRGQSSTAFFQGCLQLFGVIQMGNEGRADLYEQCLELLVLGTGNQGFVECLYDTLVISDLVVNIRTIECAALEFLQSGKVV